MKIVVIEDQAMFRRMVVQLCRAHFDCERLEEATNGADGLRLCMEVQPDIVLLDLDLPDTFGADVIDRIVAAVSRVRIIILSSHTEDYALHRSLKAQVQGFVDKNNEPPEIVLEAIRTVMSGRTFFTAAALKVKTLLRSDPTAFNKLLTDREEQLLVLLANGDTNEEIGTKLSLSHKTVNNHRRNIMAKLGLHTTPELMRYALEKGFTRLRPVGRS